MTTLIDWISQHNYLLSTLAVASVILLLLSIIATPWLVSRLPLDYLVRPRKRSLKHPVIRLLFDTTRTLTGVSLILLGLVMLVIPGPGLVTLVVGISLASFPGKQKLMRQFASHRAVFASLNWMRQRRGKPPLHHPDEFKKTLS